MSAVLATALCSEAVPPDIKYTRVSVATLSWCRSLLNKCLACKTFNELGSEPFVFEASLQPATWQP
ncbi:hypothetical protein ColTof4_12418 [Colletotrichum tofieldiae]|nr:hypothetical protein ColTof3_06630 [Colletotrichum tofieldiae]GKT79995.1 hypothetical protein ColTof4_12418 [Colletotrichum tofieldiae]GKT85448.1 hypothetical protein Ct61P_03298 [Colletotrichum tofieldiae]